jgi:hypothetical protein
LEALIATLEEEIEQVADEIQAALQQDAAWAAAAAALTMVTGLGTLRPPGS